MFDEEHAREQARDAMERLSRRIARGDANPGDAERLANARMEVAQRRYARAAQIASDSRPEKVVHDGTLRRIINALTV